MLLFQSEVVRSVFRLCFRYRLTATRAMPFSLATVVAAHRRNLRSDDPFSRGHPRPIKQRLKL